MDFTQIHDEPFNSIERETVRRVLDYVGHFLEASDFLATIRSEETMPEKAVTLAGIISSTLL